MIRTLSAVMLSRRNGSWDDGDPESPEAAAAFVIEWSKDRGNTERPSSVSGTSSWAGLRSTFHKKVRALENKFSEALLENGKGLKSDLNFWLRGLRSADGRAYKGTIDQLKASIGAEGLIPLTIGDTTKLSLSPRGIDLVRKRVETQLALSLQRQANQIAHLYPTSPRRGCQEGREQSQALAIENEINACGETGEHFEHLGSESSISQKGNNSPTGEPKPRRTSPSNSRWRFWRCLKEQRRAV